MIVNSFVTPSTQKEFSAVSELGMLAKFWAQQWIPGWILSNFHLNNISVAQKLAELELLLNLAKSADAILERGLIWAGGHICWFVEVE